MSETQLQHHVEIGPDPHGAADVLASLIRTDQRDGKDLPDGLPPSVVYKEPHGPDRIPAPATVAREGAAACGALCRAEASKEKASHVGVCRAIGHDGKPVHHAFLVSVAKPGQLPLITGPDGKSLGPVDQERIKDPSKKRGMNCGCNVPDALYQGASFSPIHPDTLGPDHPGGQASALVHAEPSERAAAGMSYQGEVRAHLPTSEHGHAIAQVAALAARAVTPPPGHEPRPAHELHPHPEVHHPEVDKPSGHGKIHAREHLDRMTSEVVGALHTIAGGKNPHQLPEDPPVTPSHADAARSMIGTIVKAAKSIPAQEHFENDPERQAQLLAVVPAHEQVKIREQLLGAAANLEHADTSDPKKDAAVTVASELDSLLPGVLPPEIGHSLRRRRANAQSKRAVHEHLATEMIGFESDASLATSLALMVALDEWHVGCPWDGRRPPPPDHAERPVSYDAPVAGIGDERRALDAALAAALERARAKYAASGRDLQDVYLDPEVAAAQRAIVDFDKAHPDAILKGMDPAIGHGGGGGGGHYSGGGGGGHGFGGGRRFGYGLSGLDFLDCGDGYLPLDPLMGQAEVEEEVVEEVEVPVEMVTTFQNHPQAVEWIQNYGENFWMKPEWQRQNLRKKGGRPVLRPGGGPRREELFRGNIVEVMNQVQHHPRAQEWVKLYGVHFWEHPEWQHKYWHRNEVVNLRPEEILTFRNHPRAAEWIKLYGENFWLRPEWQKKFYHHGTEFRRGVTSGPEHPRGWLGPQNDEHGRPLVIGQSQRNGTHTWGGNKNGWVPTATWNQGHLSDGRFHHDHPHHPHHPPGAPAPAPAPAPIVTHAQAQHPAPVVHHQAPSPVVVHAPASAPLALTQASAPPPATGTHRAFTTASPTDRFVACSLIGSGSVSVSDPRITGWHGWSYRGHDRMIRDRHHAEVLRRYWSDAKFRSEIDAGNVVDGWDLPAISEILDPPVYGWWGRMWGHEDPKRNWWRRDRSWDRGWDWWAARLPAGHEHREWFRRFHAEPDFRRRAEAGELINGVGLGEVLAWSRRAVPGSVPDVVVGFFGRSVGGAPGAGGFYRSPVRYAPQVVPVAPRVDQYGNTLDQYGNPIVGPGGGPVMGPFGPMASPVMQVPLHGIPAGFGSLANCGIPPELLDVPTNEGAAEAVADGFRDARRAVKGRPCPTGRCPKT